MTSEDTDDSSTDTEAHGAEGLTLREKLWRKVHPTGSPKGPSKSAAQVAKQLKLKAKQQEEKLMQKFDEATKIRSHSDSDVTKKSCKHYGEKRKRLGLPQESESPQESSSGRSCLPPTRLVLN